MPPQVLHLPDLNAAVFGRANHVVQAHNLAAGIDGAGDEQTLGVALHRSGTRNPVIQEETAGREFTAC